MGYVCTNTKRIKAQVWAILAMTKQAFALLLFLSFFFSLVESQTRHFCLLKPSCIESFAFKTHLTAIKQCMFRITKKHIVCQTEIEGTVRLFIFDIVYRN